jgi:nucleoside-diphosphate-sugar epimerase
MFVRLFRGRPVLIPGDGTTLDQIGHVYDEACAPRLMMQNTKTFGRHYNLTGADAYTDEGYVDTFAEVAGVKARKIFVPAEVMNDLYAMRAPFGAESALVADKVARAIGGDNRMLQLFQLQKIMQRIAPNIHGWNRNVFFSIERLKRDIGWEPRFTFRGAVERTWEWMRA